MPNQRPHVSLHPTPPHPMQQSGSSSPPPTFSTTPPHTHAHAHTSPAHCGSQRSHRVLALGTQRREHRASRRYAGTRAAQGPAARAKPRAYALAQVACVRGEARDGDAHVVVDHEGLLLVAGQLGRPPEQHDTPHHATPRSVHKRWAPPGRLQATPNPHHTTWGKMHKQWTCTQQGTLALAGGRRRGQRVG
jgi:hypothetical protein